MTDLAQRLRERAKDARAYGAVNDASMLEEAAAALEAARRDGERLDLLDSLTKRTEYQNSKRPAVSVRSDMHFDERRVSLYIRNLYGHVVSSATAETVRAAIDEAIERGKPKLAEKQEPTTTTKQRKGKKRGG